MEMNLTGLPISAQEAASYGLVSKVFPVEELVDQAVKTADVIAGHSKFAVVACKQVKKADFKDWMKLLSSHLCQAFGNELNVTHAHGMI